MKTQGKSFRKADLLFKYVNGSITVEESAELKELLANEEPDKKLFEDISPAELTPRSAEGKEQVWRSVVSHTARRSRHLRLRRMTGYAAAVVIAVAGSAVLWLQMRNDRPSDEIQAISNIPFVELSTGEIIEISESVDIIGIIAEADMTAQVASPETFTKVVVPLGTDCDFILPDSSRVYIFPGSELEFATKFEDNRTVKLTGEAFFDVRHDPLHPFHVVASGVDVTVLGTRFNIRAYRETGIVETALVNGSVDVEGTVIEPNTMAGYDIYSGVVQIREIMGGDFVARTKSLFVFRDKSLKAIMDELGLWYDFDYIFADPLLGDELFTFEIGREKSIAEILRRLELTGVVKFHRNGTNLTISSR